MPRTLLIVAHVPSPNTLRLRDAVVEGARNVHDAAQPPAIEIVAKTPFQAAPEDVLRADAIILGTTENLGYMSGALKDFFDRCYYPCLEKTQGLAHALYIRAGHDGTGTKRAVSAITTGLRWRAVQEPLTLRGEWQDEFVDQCRDLGSAMSAGLDAGIF